MLEEFETLGALSVFLPFDVGVFEEVDVGGLQAGHGGDETQVGDGQVVAGAVLLAFEEGVQQFQGVLHSCKLLLVGWGTAEYLWVLEGMNVVDLYGWKIY